MNALTRWDPFKEMDDLQPRLESQFGLAPTPTSTGRQELTIAAICAPSTEISPNSERWLLKVDFPEAKMEDVKVTVFRPSRTNE